MNENKDIKKRLEELSNGIANNVSLNIPYNYITDINYIEKFNPDYDKPVKLIHVTFMVPENNKNAKDSKDEKDDSLIKIVAMGLSADNDCPNILSCILKYCKTIIEDLNTKNSPHDILFYLKSDSLSRNYYENKDLFCIYHNKSFYLLQHMFTDHIICKSLDNGKPDTETMAQDIYEFIKKFKNVNDYETWLIYIMRDDFDV